MAITLPKLGPTGKKVAIGAATAGVVTLGAFTIAKKAEQKRVQGADKEMDEKYPFSQNCLEMQHILKTARLALAQLEAESGGNAGAKRVRARNVAALKKRITEIETFLPNLDCSKAVLAPDGLPQSSSSTIVYGPDGTPQVVPNQGTSNTTKYLLYGVAGVILLVVFSNLFKKKD